jgi:PEP-CTERM motif
MNRMWKIGMRVGLSALALSMAGGAQAAIIYDFVGLSSATGTPFGKFTVSQASLIPVGTGGNYTTATCSVTFPASGFTCNPTMSINNSATLNQITFRTAQGSTVNFQTSYNFAPGSFSALGTYTSIQGPNNFASLIIRDTNAVPVVPEPASWAMMIAGFGIVGGTVRRRGAASVRLA